MKSIAVLTSPEVPLPAEGCALLDTLPCTTTVCTPGNAAEVVGASEACFVWDTDPISSPNGMRLPTSRGCMSQSPEWIPFFS